MYETWFWKYIINRTEILHESLIENLIQKMNTCTCRPYEDCTYCLDNFYEEKKKVKRERNKRRQQRKWEREVAEPNYYLELWAKESGLKIETLKDLIGLNFD